MMQSHWVKVCGGHFGCYSLAVQGRGCHRCSWASLQRVCYGANKCWPRSASTDAPANQSVSGHQEPDQIARTPLEGSDRFQPHFDFDIFKGKCAVRVWQTPSYTDLLGDFRWKELQMAQQWNAPDRRGGALAFDESIGYGRIWGGESSRSRSKDRTDPWRLGKLVLGWGWFDVWCLMRKKSLLFSCSHVWVWGILLKKEPT